MSTSCVVVDYGLGNVFSVMQALRDFPVECRLSSDVEAIRRADRLILPGVGAFGRAALRLRSLGLEEPILEFIGTGRPFLGICVGMQLLHDIGNEFGEHQGLGLIRGRVEQIDMVDEEGQRLRVPLIGWHPLLPPEGDYGRWNGTPLEGLPRDSAFYFVHSFAARLADPSATLAVTRHGGHDLTAAVCKDNVIGTQFHPERSAHAGRAFLQSFLSL
ncbi:imidazole glycerol phosphate synthase subunit HisH [Tsuneonella sp. HG249]